MSARDTAMPSGVEVGAVELRGVVDQRRVAAVAHIVDDGAHGGVDVGR